MSKVFLGGTCNGSTWRDELIPLLEIDYFNPVVEDWTDECQAIEVVEKSEKCDIHLYVITSDMIGVFSIAEAVQSSHERGKFTVFHVFPDGFSVAQIKSLNATCDLLRKNGCLAYVDDNLHKTAVITNTFGS